MTSAMTLGCLILERGKWRSRVNMMMMPAYRDNCQQEEGRQAGGEAYLNDEDEDGVLWVISGGVGSLKDASLIGCSDHHGDSRLRQ